MIVLLGFLFILPVSGDSNGGVASVAEARKLGNRKRFRKKSDDSSGGGGGGVTKFARAIMDILKDRKHVTGGSDKTKAIFPKDLRERVFDDLDVKGSSKNKEAFEYALKRLEKKDALKINKHGRVKLIVSMDSSQVSRGSADSDKKRKRKSKDMKQNRVIVDDDDVYSGGGASTDVDDDEEFETGDVNDGSGAENKANDDTVTENGEPSPLLDAVDPKEPGGQPYDVDSGKKTGPDTDGTGTTGDASADEDDSDPAEGIEASTRDDSPASDGNDADTDLVVDADKNGTEVSAGEDATTDPEDEGKAIGESCDSDSDCLNDACGATSVSLGSDKVCCATGSHFQGVCTGQEDGEPCAVTLIARQAGTDKNILHDICDSGFCNIDGFCATPGGTGSKDDGKSEANTSSNAEDNGETGGDSRDVGEDPLEEVMLSSTQDGGSCGTGCIVGASVGSVAAVGAAAGAVVAKKRKAKREEDDAPEADNEGIV